MKSKTPQTKTAYYVPKDRITITLTQVSAGALNAVRDKWHATHDLNADMSTNGWPADATLLCFALLLAARAD